MRLARATASNHVHQIVGRRVYNLQEVHILWIKTTNRLNFTEPKYTGSGNLQAISFPYIRYLLRNMYHKADYKMHNISYIFFFIKFKENHNQIENFYIGKPSLIKVIRIRLILVISVFVSHNIQQK